ncbi:hypothetical protein HY968_01755 [Candidatus Kaiserbacteria bacterium]|nr:hypothetical protein [Candidatus Kaiserbacteria bacterium]
MKNISIQLHKKTRIFGIEHPRERFFMQIFLTAIIVLLCIYLYLVCASVLNVMARREARASSKTLQGSIGALEQKYFALSEGITTDVAASLGLAPIERTAYVHRPGAVGIVESDLNAI